MMKINMIRKKRRFELVVTMVMVTALAGCGVTASSDDSTSAASIVSESQNTETGQSETNPIEHEQTEGDMLTQTFGNHIKLTYPSDRFVYDDLWKNLESTKEGQYLTIGVNFFSQSLDEAKTQFEDASYVESEGYALEETTVAGHQAIVCKYSDSLGYSMAYTIDNQGMFDSPNAVTTQITVNADIFEDLTDSAVIDVIQSIEFMK